MPSETHCERLVVMGDSLHRSKPDGIPALSEGSGHELPSLTEKLSLVGTNLKGRKVITEAFDLLTVVPKILRTQKNSTEAHLLLSIYVSC